LFVKVGSSLLIDAAKGEVRAAWLKALAADIARLHGEGGDVLVVSSGAIALGRSRLNCRAGRSSSKRAKAPPRRPDRACPHLVEVRAITASAPGRSRYLAGYRGARRYLNARSTTSDQMRASAIWPTAAAPWLSSSERPARQFEPAAPERNAPRRPPALTASAMQPGDIAAKAFNHARAPRLCCVDQERRAT